MCQCNKTCHFDMASAVDHADRLQEKLGTRPSIYACPDGTGAIHVGYANEALDDMPRRKRRQHKAARARRRVRKFANGRMPKWVKGRRRKRRASREEWKHAHLRK